MLCINAKILMIVMYKDKCVYIKTDGLEVYILYIISLILHKVHKQLIFY